MCRLMIRRLRVSRLATVTLTPLYFIVPTIRVCLQGRQYVSYEQAETLARLMKGQEL